ncbi:MAG TPA: hypothetical protein VM933_06800 [Acidimicrobiales bacterium]|nr:hypothetical protein [Acidimicrobiales bacterium]
MHPLDRLSVDDLVACSSAFKDLGRGAGSMEAAGQAIVEYLRRELVDGEGRPACALVRFYRTLRFRDLPDELRDFAGAVEDDRTRCLTLLGTAGEAPAWNDRRRSDAHAAIPLVDEEVVAASPMIAGLIDQLGVDVAAVVGPPSRDPGRANLHHRDYDVFFVPEAAGSPMVPAQDDFVVRHGIRSVVGCGGILPSGDLFALILFTKVTLSPETAALFRTLALSVKAAIVPFTFEPFSSAGS